MTFHILFQITDKERTYGYDMDGTPEHTTNTNGSAKKSSQMLEMELMVRSI